MKAFRLFDDMRATLRKDTVQFLPNGPGSDKKWMQIGLKRREFYGRILKELCTDELLALCTGKEIEYATLETFCRDLDHSTVCIPMFEAVSAAFCKYALAHQTVPPAEGAFYLLFATQTLAFDGKVLDLKTYDHEVAFGLYCLDRATEEK